MSYRFSVLALLLTTACSNKFDGEGDSPNGQQNDTEDTDETGVNGDTYTDDDGDGYSEVDGDCDDANPNVAPNQAEECNGVDDDCNGQIDEAGGDTLYYADDDGDTFGDPGDVVTACSQPAGYVTNDDDCDDDHDTAYPGGTEVSWNDIDEDCDGVDFEVDTCVSQGINAASEEMTSGVWSIEPYEGTYRETITGFNLPIANWTISNQYLSLTEVNTEHSVNDTDELDFTVRFNVNASMNDSSYTGYYYKGDYGALIEGPFWIDVQMDSIYSYLGLDYATYCDAWVDPVAQGFTGSLSLSVNVANQRVTGDAQLSSIFSPLTANDVNTISVSGSSDCQLSYIDLVIDQLGYGDTLGILDETFEVTLASLEETYEDVLERKITAFCSAPN
jgi:hypothetical protein